MPLLELPPPEPGLFEALARICGSGFVSTREPARLAYSRDMWPRMLIRQRAGKIDYPPDAVAWPGTPEEVAEVVKLALERKLPVIAFGAGSGVCGATLPVRGGVVVDLKRLNRVLSLEPLDCLLEVEVGAVGEILERELERRGFTLGHFPSSMYCSTVGGWIAARSAGQCSSRYGKIEDLVRSLTFVDSQGALHRTPLKPPGFAPWSLDHLLVGSEGTLGIVVSASLVVRPAPAGRWFRAYKFPDITSGLSAMRGMLRAGLRPSVVRLYDEFDTVIAKIGPEEEVEHSLFADLASRASAPLKRLAGMSLRTVLGFPGLLNRLVGLLPGGCLMVVIHEGEDGERELAAGLIPQLCRSLGAEDLGEGPARHWWTHRYSISYKQSPLFADGAFVDTMEVATTWDRLSSLYRAVRRAVSPLAFIMAHFSHAYREGCSIYFTFAGAAGDDAAAAALYDRIWDAAQGAVSAEGATVSHHHGIGLSKQRFLVRQLGEANRLAAAVKAAFDPEGLLNPGKLGQVEGRIGHG